MRDFCGDHIYSWDSPTNSSKWFIHFAAQVHCSAPWQTLLTSCDWLMYNDICKILRWKLNNSASIDRFSAGLSKLRETANSEEDCVRAGQVRSMQHPSYNYTSRFKRCFEVSWEAFVNGRKWTHLTTTVTCVKLRAVFPGMELHSTGRIMGLNHFQLMLCTKYEYLVRHFV